MAKQELIEFQKELYKGAREFEPSPLVHHNASMLIDDEFRADVVEADQKIEQDGKVFYRMDILVDGQTGKILNYGLELHNDLQSSREVIALPLIMESTLGSMHIYQDGRNHAKLLSRNAEIILERTFTLYNQFVGVH